MKAGKMGVLSALVASICCAGPLVLLLLGLGSLGLGTIFGRFHWFFIIAALGILAVAWRLYQKESRRCEAAHCEMEGRKPARTTLIAASILVALFIGLNLYTYAGQWFKAEPAFVVASSGKAQITLPVEGMTCFACEITIEKALTSLDGVEKADAKVTQKSVTVFYDPQKVSVDQLIAAVNRTGYRAHAPEEAN